MIVHACHCTDCQCRSGSAFAVSLWIERDSVVLQSGKLVKRPAPAGESGKPYDSWSCSDCGTAVWGYFHKSPPGSLFVRAGTMDDPSAFVPDVHIFTRSKQTWVTIPDDVPSFEAFYDLKETWSADSLKRLGEMSVSDPAKGTK
jgi:hypothetical protein